MARGKHHEWLTEDGLLRIESWASDGLSNKQISENMGISRETLNVWSKKYPDISDSLKKGREPVVRHVENEFIKRARGYQTVDVRKEVFIDKDGKKKTKITEITTNYPPDVSAGIFLLKNYKPNKYRQYNDITHKKMEAEIKKLEAEAKRAELEIEVNESQEDKLSSYISMLKEAIIDE